MAISVDTCTGLHKLCLKYEGLVPRGYTHPLQTCDYIGSYIRGLHNWNGAVSEDFACVASMGLVRRLHALETSRHLRSPIWSSG